MVAPERVGTRDGRTTSAPSRATPSSVARVVTVVVMAALVAFAGYVLLRPVPTTTTTGTVTSAAPPAQVCLAVDGGPMSLCLDAEHVDHLALGGATAGECVDVSYQGRLLVDESLTRVSARPC